MENDRKEGRQLNEDEVWKDTQRHRQRAGEKLMYRIEEDQRVCAQVS